MGWKDWSYWLKGGIIGSITGIILNLLMFSCAKGCYEMGCISCIFLNPLMLTLYDPAPLYYHLIQYIISFILNIVFFSLIGAIIGWIIGKVKSKNKTK